MHRVIRIMPDGTITPGDNNRTEPYGIRFDNIIGKIIAAKKRTRRVAVRGGRLPQTIGFTSSCCFVNMSVPAFFCRFRHSYAGADPVLHLDPPPNPAPTVLQSFEAKLPELQLNTFPAPVEQEPLATSGPAVHVASAAAALPSRHSMFFGRWFNGSTSGRMYFMAYSYIEPYIQPYHSLPDLYLKMVSEVKTICVNNLKQRLIVD